MIPVLDREGRITSILLRPTNSSKGKKYCYLSLAGRGGAKASRSIHVPKFTGDTATVRVTEGIVKADVATDLSGMLTLGLPGLHAKGLPKLLGKLVVKTVRLSFDKDAATNPNVARAVAKHFKTLTAAGFNVELERRAPDAGKGIDDCLAGGKPTEVLAGDAAAEAVKALQAEAKEKQAAGRVEVFLSDHEADVVRQVVAALAEHDSHIYQRGGELVTVVTPPGPKGVPTIVPLTVSSVRNRITDVVVLIDPENGTASNPPMWLAGAVKDLKDWPGVRPLLGVTSSPVLRPDGSVHQTAGYDAATALLYVPDGPFPAIPADPTREDAVAGLEQLKTGVSEFPWQEPSDLSAWLAEVVTLCVRSAIDGPCPGFYHTANTAGSGKTALCKASAIISGFELPSARPTRWRARRTTGPRTSKR